MKKKVKGSVIVELTFVFPVIFILAIGMFAVTLYCFQDTLDSTAHMEQVNKTLSAADPPFCDQTYDGIIRMKRKSAAGSNVAASHRYSLKEYVDMRSINSFPTEQKVTDVGFLIAKGKTVICEAIPNKWYDLRLNTACR